MPEKTQSFSRHHGHSPFFFVSDHAGKVFPKHLGNLGLSLQDQERHITYDIGVSELGRFLAQALDATLIEQVFSRLVIDCNRKPEREDHIPVISDGTIIPGNQNLSKIARDWRHKQIFEPYHAEIAETLEKRLSQNQQVMFVSLHSFTPELKENPENRPWEIGLLFNHDCKTAHDFKQKLLHLNPNLCIGENQPYYLDLEKEYTVPQHAARHNLPSLEIEVRQDLLQNKTSFKKISELLLKAFMALEQDLYGDKKIAH